MLKYHYPQYNESFMDITLKATEQGSCSKPPKTHPGYGWKLYEHKDLTFWQNIFSSDEIKLNCSIMGRLFVNLLSKRSDCCIMREGNCVGKLKQYLERIARKLNLAQTWVCQVDRYPKHALRSVALGTTKSRCRSGHHNVTSVCLGKKKKKKICGKS